MKNIKQVWQIFLLFVTIVFSLLGLTGGQAVHASPNTVSVNADQDPTQGGYTNSGIVLTKGQTVSI